MSRNPISQLAYAAVASFQWKLLSTILLSLILVWVPAAIFLGGGSASDALALILLLPLLRIPALIGQAFALEASSANYAPLPFFAKVLFGRHGGHIWSIVFQLVSCVLLLAALANLDVDTERLWLTLPCDAKGEQIGRASLTDRVASAVFAVARPLLVFSGGAASSSSLIQKNGKISLSPGGTEAETAAQSAWLARIALPSRTRDDAGLADPFFRFSASAANNDAGGECLLFNLPALPIYLSALVAVLLSIARFYLSGHDRLLQQPDAWFVPSPGNNNAAIAAAADTTGLSLSGVAPASASSSALLAARSSRFVRQARWLAGTIISDVARSVFIITPLLWVGSELLGGAAKIAITAVVGTLVAGLALFYHRGAQPLLARVFHPLVAAITKAMSASSSSSSFLAAVGGILSSVVALVSSLFALCKAALLMPALNLLGLSWSAFVSIAALVGLGTAAATTTGGAALVFAFPTILSAPAPTFAFLLFRWLPYLLLSWLVALPMSIVVSAALSFISLTEAALLRTIMTRPSAASSKGKAAAVLLKDSLFNLPSPLHTFFLRPLADSLWSTTTAGAGDDGDDSTVTAKPAAGIPKADGAALLKLRLTALGIGMTGASTNGGGDVASYLLSFPAPTAAAMFNDGQQQQGQQQHQHNYVASPWKLVKLYQNELARVSGVAAEVVQQAAAAAAQAAGSSGGDAFAFAASFPDASSSSSSSSSFLGLVVERLTTQVKSFASSSFSFVFSFATLALVLLPPFLTRSLVAAVKKPASASGSSSSSSATPDILLPPASAPAAGSASFDSGVVAGLALDNMAALLSSDRWANLLPLLAAAGAGSTAATTTTAMTAATATGVGNVKPFILAASPLEAAVLAAWMRRMASAEFALHAGDASFTGNGNGNGSLPTLTTLSALVSAGDSGSEDALASTLRASLLASVSPDSPSPSPSPSSSTALYATQAQAMYAALRQELVVKRGLGRGNAGIAGPPLGVSAAESFALQQQQQQQLAASRGAGRLGFGPFSPAASLTRSLQQPSSASFLAAAAASASASWSPSSDGATLALQGPVPAFLRLFVESLFVSPAAMPSPFKVAVFPSLAVGPSRPLSAAGGAGGLFLPVSTRLRQQRASLSTYSVTSVDSMMLLSSSGSLASAGAGSGSGSGSALESLIHALTGGYEGSSAGPSAAGGGIGQLVAVTRGREEEELARQAAVLANARARKPGGARGGDNLVVAFASSSSLASAAGFLPRLQLAASRALRMQMLQLGVASPSRVALEKMQQSVTMTATADADAGAGAGVGVGVGPGFRSPGPAASHAAAPTISRTPAGLPSMSMSMNMGMSVSMGSPSGLATGLYTGGLAALGEEAPPLRSPAAAPAALSPRQGQGQEQGQGQGRKRASSPAKGAVSPSRPHAPFAVPAASAAAGMGISNLRSTRRRTAAAAAGGL